jgi:hypothetical protein
MLLIHNDPKALSAAIHVDLSAPPSWAPFNPCLRVEYVPYTMFAMKDVHLS